MLSYKKLSRRWLLAGSVAATLSVPAAAQIQVLNPFGGPRTLNPFGSPQGSANALTTSATTTSYSSPPKQSNGLAVKYLTWAGHQWGNDSGQAWNTNVPYAIGLAPTKVRFEVHDTANDRGQIDPSTKRRSELSSSTDKFHNHTAYWMAFSFKVHWDCQACQKRVNQGGEIMQVHWPSGASPPLAFRATPTTTGASFTVTTRGDNQGNITRANVPLTLDTVHDVVFRFQLGAVGFEQVWLDGKQISNVSNIPVGTDLEDGYSMRLGPYYGGGLGGNVAVQEYGNVAAFPSVSSLMTRVTSPPVW